MKLSIRVFAGLAEKMGSAVVDLESEVDSMTAGLLKELLAQKYPEAASTIAVSFVARNQAYARPEDAIFPGDELALIPPVSGGQGASRAAEPEQTAPKESLYILTRERISVELVTQKVIRPEHGACLSFVGTTREWTQGQRTELLEYEAYEPMALSTMESIGREIGERWPGAVCAITHRLGRVDIAEASVVIAVSAPHRAECYDASRYAIERLKQIVPIWKKEIWDDGSEWKGHQLGPWDPTAEQHGGN